jgi:hypothetical protein
MATVISAFGGEGDDVLPQTIGMDSAAAHRLHGLRRDDRSTDRFHQADTNPLTQRGHGWNTCRPRARCFQLGS